MRTLKLTEINESRQKFSQEFILKGKQRKLFCINTFTLWRLVPMAVDCEWESTPSSELTVYENDKWNDEFFFWKVKLRMALNFVRFLRNWNSQFILLKSAGLLLNDFVLLHFHTFYRFLIVPNALIEWYSCKQHLLGNFQHFLVSEQGMTSNSKITLPFLIVVFNKL